MYTFYFIYLTSLLFHTLASDESGEPILYYYGLEESERGLPACARHDACSVLLRRYWRAAALLRLCRCERRTRCDTRASDTRTVEVNDRAHLQFCKPVTGWPECDINEAPLTVEGAQGRMDPDRLGELHHRNVQLTPPRIHLECRCRRPNYWKLKTENDTIMTYQCTSLPLCRTGDFCGNVDNDLLSLYQSCLCPKNHICVHSGGSPRHQITELLYRGSGWRAHCQPLGEDYGCEDY